MSWGGAAEAPTRPAPLMLTQLCMEQANPSGPLPNPNPLLSCSQQADKQRNGAHQGGVPSFSCEHPKLFQTHTFPYSCPPSTHSSLPHLYSGSQPLHLYKTLTPPPTHSYSFSYSRGNILKSFPWRKKKPLLLLPLTVDTASCPPPLPVQHLEDVCPVLTLLHHLFLPSTLSPKAALLDATDDFLVGGSHGPLAAFIQSTSSEAFGEIVFFLVSGSLALRANSSQCHCQGPHSPKLLSNVSVPRVPTLSCAFVCHPGQF